MQVNKSKNWAEITNPVIEKMSQTLFFVDYELNLSYLKLPFSLEANWDGSFDYLLAF